MWAVILRIYRLEILGETYYCEYRRDDAYQQTSFRFQKKVTHFQSPEQNMFSKTYIPKIAKGDEDHSNTKLGIFVHPEKALASMQKSKWNLVRKDNETFYKFNDFNLNLKMEMVL